MLCERPVEQNGLPDFCVYFNDLCVLVFFTLVILLLLVPILVVSLFILGIQMKMVAGLEAGICCMLWTNRILYTLKRISATL